MKEASEARAEKLEKSRFFCFHPKSVPPRVSIVILHLRTGADGEPSTVCDVCVGRFELPREQARTLRT
eukprot:8178842-Pyramimonas_sp.AAC.1